MNGLAKSVFVLGFGITGLSSTARAQTGEAPRPSQDVSAIAAGTIPADSPELSVTAAVAVATTPQPDSRLDSGLLDREIDAKFASLDHCRTDVARRKRVPPARILADKLTLRWTILGQGEVAAMDVVGSTPVDPGVLDCIKRDAKGWLTDPVGGDLRLNRALVFRRLPTGTPR